MHCNCHVIVNCHLNLQIKTTVSRICTEAADYRHPILGLEPNQFTSIQSSLKSGHTDNIRTLVSLSSTVSGNKHKYVTKEM